MKLEIGEEDDGDDKSLKAQGGAIGRNVIYLIEG